MSKARDYRFTLNNYTAEEEIKLKELEGVSYIVFVHEICYTIANVSFYNLSLAMIFIQ